MQVNEMGQQGRMSRLIEQIAADDQIKQSHLGQSIVLVAPLEAYRLQVMYHRQSRWLEL